MQRATVVTALGLTAVSEGWPANKKTCGTVAAGAAYRRRWAAVQVEQHERWTTARSVSPLAADDAHRPPVVRSQTRWLHKLQRPQQRTIWHRYIEEWVCFACENIPLIYARYASTVVNNLENLKFVTCTFFLCYQLFLHHNSVNFVWLCQGKEYSRRLFLKVTWKPILYLHHSFRPRKNRLSAASRPSWWSLMLLRLIQSRSGKIPGDGTTSRCWTAVFLWRLAVFISLSE